jgi:hypothetical protein
LWIDGVANIDALVADTADINAGTIDATVIGATTPAAGSFTTVNASGTITGNLTGNVTGNVTGALTGNATTATTLATARTITLSGDVAGSVSFDGSANVTITTTVQADSVALGTDTTGNYVAGISGTTNQVTVTSGTGEGVSPVLSLPATIVVPGTLTVTGAATITSGSITGITDLAVADGGTGASTLTGYVKGAGTTALTASATIPNTDITGLGTMSTQAASSVTITGGSITGITDLTVADGGTGASDAAGARTNLGLGNIATQTASSVTITGGSITGITDLTVADGGTGASTLTGYVKGAGTTALTASATIPNTDITGLGTMSTQAASSVAITGGSISGITDLAVADGGTGASTGAGAVSNFGITATIAELNFVAGVTSSIQTQLGTKIPNNADAALTGGYTTTADADGTFSTGTYTPVPSGGNMKTITNGGAFTLAAPSATGDYTLIIRMVNSATAGAVTLSGFTKSGGDMLTTTNGHVFFLYITKCGGSVALIIQALQ